VANDSFQVAKFLINQVNAGLGDVAKGISDWLGGNVPAAFWAIANGAGRGYDDALRGLIWGGLLGNNYSAAQNFLVGQIGLGAALGVLNDVF
jgi:hypothetical protein